MASDIRVTTRQITQQLINKARRDKDHQRVAVLTTARNASLSAGRLAPKEHQLQRPTFTKAQVHQFMWRLDMERLGRSWLILEDAYVNECEKNLHGVRPGPEYNKCKRALADARRACGPSSLRAYEKWKKATGADNKA